MWGGGCTLTALCVPSGLLLTPFAQRLCYNLIVTNIVWPSPNMLLYLSLSLMSLQWCYDVPESSQPQLAHLQKEAHVLYKAWWRSEDGDKNIIQESGSAGMDFQTRDLAVGVWFRKYWQLKMKRGIMPTVDIGMHNTNKSDYHMFLIYVFFCPVLYFDVFMSYSMSIPPPMSLDVSISLRGKGRRIISILCTNNVCKEIDNKVNLTWLNILLSQMWCQILYAPSEFFIFLTHLRK